MHVAHIWKSISGVKLYSERRYSQEESSKSTDNELKNCNTAIAVKLVGMHIDPNIETCTIPKLLNNVDEHA